MAGNHFLTRAGFAGNQNGGLGRRHLLGQLDHRGHRLVAIDQVAALLCDGLQGPPRSSPDPAAAEYIPWRPARIADTAAWASVSTPQATTGTWTRSFWSFRISPGNVEMHLDHQKVGAPAGSEYLQGSLDIVGMGDLSAALHRDLRSRRQLTAKGSDN